MLSYPLATVSSFFPVTVIAAKLTKPAIRWVQEMDGPRAERYFKPITAWDWELVAFTCLVFKRGPPVVVAAQFHAFFLILAVRLPSVRAVRRGLAFMTATIRLGQAASMARLPAVIVTKAQLTVEMIESTAETDFPVHYSAEGELVRVPA